MSNLNWIKRIPVETATTISSKYSLDHRLVIAIIQQESGGQSFACRFEPNYKWLYNVNDLAKSVGCTANTMTVMQMTSWGLMQVMGAVAYEDGFNPKQYVSQLVLPHIGIEAGCKRLEKLWKKHKTIDQVISAYNAGSLNYDNSGKYNNQNYVDSVLGYMVQVP